MSNQQIEEAPRDLRFPSRAQDIVLNLANHEIFKSKATNATIWAWALAFGYKAKTQKEEPLGNKPLVSRIALERYYKDLPHFIVTAYKSDLTYLDPKKEKEVYTEAQRFVNAGIFLLDELLLDDSKTETIEELLIEKLLELNLEMNEDDDETT
ncbi:MAG: hypothetical protein ACFFB5_04450 [Promethearchaeota archaeon]